MREIKFRAWHKQLKQMSKPWALHETSTMMSWMAAMSSLEIMQYTGLKDKNGKEIYEGDIIISTRIFDKQTYFVCQWDYNYGSWDFFNDDSKYSLGGGSYEDMEIVGNIYENPDLIK